MHLLFAMTVIGLWLLLVIFIISASMGVMYVGSCNWGITHKKKRFCKPLLNSAPLIFETAN